MPLLLAQSANAYPSLLAGILGTLLSDDGDVHLKNSQRILLNFFANTPIRPVT